MGTTRVLVHMQRCYVRKAPSHSEATQPPCGMHQPCGSVSSVTCYSCAAEMIAAVKGSSHIGQNSLMLVCRGDQEGRTHSMHHPRALA